MLTDYFHVQLCQLVELLIPLDSISEVISLKSKEICPIPGVIPAMLGVVNQRGKLLWILDLSNLLDVPSTTKSTMYQKNLTIVVLGDSINSLATGQAERKIGCTISVLKDTISLNSDDFKPAPVKPASPFSSLAPLMTKIEQLPVAVLDVQAVFAAIQISATTPLVNSSC